MAGLARHLQMSHREFAKSRSVAARALKAMHRLGICPTPANYAIWFDYFAGQNPTLKRTIDVLLSNGAAFDESTLQDLYANFFSCTREAAQAVRQTSTLALRTLEEIGGVADLAQQDAQEYGTRLKSLASKPLDETLVQLKRLVETLAAEAQDMAGRSEYVGMRMRESAEQIHRLEQNLESALRDSTLDGLTGVANRKTFDAKLRSVAGDAMNSGEDVALLMIDIDYFKRINDTLGHQTGDQVLRDLAGTLQRAVRGEDYVARYGGEEFAVILPHTDLDAAVAVGENIRQALVREPVSIGFTALTPSVTVSIGVSCYDPGEPLEDWVQRSDSSLYRAKREGRNRVEYDRVCQ